MLTCPILILSSYELTLQFIELFNWSAQFIPYSVFNEILSFEAFGCYVTSPDLPHAKHAPFSQRLKISWCLRSKGFTKKLLTQGDKGVDGKEGPPGREGPPGLAGPRGDDGKVGFDGSKGKSGEAGPRGQKGMKGENVSWGWKRLSIKPYALTLRLVWISELNQVECRFPAFVWNRWGLFEQDAVPVWTTSVARNR